MKNIAWLEYLSEHPWIWITLLGVIGTIILCGISIRLYLYFSDKEHKKKGDRRK